MDDVFGDLCPRILRHVLPDPGRRVRSGFSASNDLGAIRRAAPVSGGLTRNTILGTFIATSCCLHAAPALAQPSVKDWQVFQDVKFGIELRVPPNWEARGNLQAPLRVLVGPPSVPINCTVAAFIGTSAAKTDAEVEDILQATEYGEETRAFYLGQVRSAFGDGASIESVGPTTHDGKRGVRIEFRYEEGNLHYFVKRVILPYRNVVYTITCGLGTSTFNTTSTLYYTMAGALFDVFIDGIAVRPPNP